MKCFQITEAKYEAIKAKEAKTKDKNISRRLRVLMLRCEGKKLYEITKMTNLHRTSSITQIYRRYRGHIRRELPPPPEVVKNRFKKMSYHHIEYVFLILDKKHTEVRNIQQYLMTTLYHAPTTMSNYFDAEVRSAGLL